MIARVSRITIALLLATATAGLAQSAQPVDHGGVLAVAELDDLRGRWEDVTSLPGLPELLRSSAAALGWSEGAIPDSFAPREALVFFSVDGGPGVRLARVPSQEVARIAHARIDALWDARLGEAPLVRGVIDLASVRRMLRDWAAEEPIPLRALAWEILAARLEPFDAAVFSRDVVRGRIRGAAWLRYRAPGQDGAALAGFALAPGEAAPLEGGIGLAQLPALVRLLGALDGLSVDITLEEGGMLVVGQAPFDPGSTDRP